MKKLLLADGSNIMFRSFYAMRPFTTKDGLHTNAVYGLATTLSRHIDAIKPDGVAVAFDLPAPTFRHERYAEYKGTRRPTPAELVEQLPYIKRCAAAMGATVLEVPGFEADDLLGSLAADGEREGYLVYVLTGDRDALQLITENVSVILLTNKEDIIYTPERFREEYGTEPARLVDIKALMGDASDNIPGVPGIGKTTALKLVSTVGGIDVIYNSIDTLPASESVKKKLLDGRELAFMSAELAKIRRDAPVGITARELGSSYKGMDKASLRTLFAELEFHRLTERFGLIEKDNKEDTSSENAASVSVSVSDKTPEILPLDEKTARTIKKAAVALDTGKDKLIIKTEDAVYEADIASTAAADLLTGDTEIYCHDYKA
ncbi:MAG TPA: 5'-3' exonuclease H3TH domain-containing protein, partial [Bacillota bacterium]|nr:5'-3' exonuclease H3TH domain-containing protein [Bacillota bacterium]